MSYYLIQSTLDRKSLSLDNNFTTENGSLFILPEYEIVSTLPGAPTLMGRYAAGGNECSVSLTQNSTSHEELTSMIYQGIATRLLAY